MYPRLTFDLDAIGRATQTLAERLLSRGIELVGVTKAVDGEPAVGRAMLEAGCAGLADSRLPALVRLAAQALAPLTLLRAPQPHEIAAAAQIADRVLLCDARDRRGTRRARARAAGRAAARRSTSATAAKACCPGRPARRHAASPACPAPPSPASPSTSPACPASCRASALFRRAEEVLATVAGAGAVDAPLLSLGGSCCLQCLAGFEPRFRTEIRSGGGPLYGYDFVSGATLDGLERFDPVLTATVLESFFKPPAPPGAAGLDAFGHVPDTDSARRARLVRPGGPRTPRLRAARPASAARRRLARRHDERRGRAHHADASCAPARPSTSPSTTTRWCAP